MMNMSNQDNQANQGQQASQGHQGPQGQQGPQGHQGHRAELPAPASVRAVVTANRPLTADVWEMKLATLGTAEPRAGQFVELSLPGLYLRRPISVCDVRPLPDGEEGLETTLIYKVVGEGTAEMSFMEKETVLDVLMPLGHGFSFPEEWKRPLLVGGGVGCPPMYMLARRWLDRGVRPTVVLGFNTKEEVFLADRFRELGLETLVATADGSLGVRGFVTDALRQLPDGSWDAFQACGPLPMLRALLEATPLPGEISMEERMGCGFGGCMGCTIHTSRGPARVCTEGPVFDRELPLFS